MEGKSPAGCMETDWTARMNVEIHGCFPLRRGKSLPCSRGMLLGDHNMYLGTADTSGNSWPPGSSDAGLHGPAAGCGWLHLKELMFGQVLRLLGRTYSCWNHLENYYRRISVPTWTTQNVYIISTRKPFCFQKFLTKSCSILHRSALW